MKIRIFFLLFISILINLPAEGINVLTDRCAEEINTFFSDKYQVKAGITEFINNSDFSENSAMKVYQLITSKLKSNTRLEYRDLFLNITGEKAVFNSTLFNKLNYFISVKITRRKSRIGLGITIYSKDLDRTVFVRYIDEYVRKEEQVLLSAKEFSFKKGVFSKLLNLKSDSELLNIASVINTDGLYRYFMLYPDRIDIYSSERSTMRKVNSVPLVWKGEYYPVIERQGIIRAHKINSKVFISTGSNFYDKSEIFLLTDKNSLKHVNTVPYIPYSLIDLNSRKLFLSVQYHMGRNYFKPEMYFYPLKGDNITIQDAYSRNVEPFYSLAVSQNSGKLNTFALIDLSYNLFFYNTQLTKMLKEEKKRGAQISAYHSWLAVSDTNSFSDKLFFYKIADGSSNFMYEADIDGAIVFINSGKWKSVSGFWVKIKKNIKGTDIYSIQFWSRSDE